MKKPPKANGLFPACLKFDLKMKLSLLFFVTASFVMQANESYSQKTKISLNKENITVKEVIDEIETTTEFKFLFNTKAVDLNRRVSVKVQKVSVNVILDILFKGSDTSYEIDDRKILLTKTKPNKTEIVSQPNLIDLSPIVVKGTIVDSKGMGLPGANVVEKGSNNGITTDSDGKFSITVQNENAILVVSFIGFETQEVSLKGQTTIKVVLKESAAVLNDVVVVGYGTQKKENLTGAVASIKGEQLLKRQVVDPVASLQGMLPGVTITQSSGQPGAEGLNIQIRGLTSYSSAGSSPLVLVNGVPGSLSDLNPNVIENISVLKDAASASIYGARAANGVILVTTKNGSGSDGKLSVNYSFTSQYSKATKLPELVTNSVDYMNLFNQAKINSGATSGFYPQSVIDLYKNPSDSQKYPNANWEDYMFRTAPTYMHNLSVDGGTRQTSYDFSLGYVDQQGTMQGFEYKKYNAMFNLISEVNSNLKVGINLGYKAGDQSQPRNGANDAFYQTLAHAPTALPWLPDGSGRYTYRAYSWEFVRPNQFAANNQLSRNLDYSFNSQVWADVKILKGLRWYTKGAVNSYFTKYKEFSETIPLYGYLTPDDDSTSSNIPGNGLNTSMSQTIYKNLFSYLEYEQKIDKHRFSAQFGYNQEQENYSVLSGSRTSYSVGGALQELNAGDATPQYNSGTSSDWALRSWFTRFKYDFDGKYLFESNLRYDGSSRFSSTKRWGVFPSFSAGWRVSEEAFMQNLKSKGWINDMKLRGSWGELGNQNIGLYPYQALLNVGGNYPFGNTLYTGAYQSALNNEDITWETTTMADLGLDLRVFDHLNITFDWYRKVTTDILRVAQVTGAVGLSAPIVNSGAMSNTGIELALNYNNSIKSGAMEGFKYGAGFNISSFKNTTTKFGEMQDNGSTIIQEGLPWNSFYLLQWDGIFQSQAEVNASPKQFGEDTKPGDLKFKDTNGDGVIDNKDRVVMKDGVFPNFTYGFNLNAEWKGFDFYAFFQGVEGLKGIFGMSPGLTPFFSGTPPLKEVADQAWTPENKSNTMPQLYFSDMAASAKVWSHPSTFLLKDMSYLRVKQLQLGYTFTKSIISKLKLNYTRVFIAGDNLFTFTKFPGTDPEKPAGSYLSYPQNKAISFGISVKF